MPTTRRGTLGRFVGSRSSGLGFLIIDGTPIPCENGPTVRALDDCFNNVVQPGHTVSSKSFEGREVMYSVDDLGLLLGFTPIEDWAGPEIPSEGLEDQ
jgi:benzoyl-CoA reductase/2-hydroxyglutaryl-CoA dehydratase subunit BcrC/BadD/HgdB